MNIFLIVVLCWLAGAVVFYFACRGNLPDEELHAVVNSLFWPGILIFIAVLRSYRKAGD
jgi:hypothetical protein